MNREMSGGIRDGNSSDKRLVAIALGIWLVTVAFSLFCGQVNQDEGFYLKTAQRVSQGWVVYRDYAFTQMPLFPYLYALPVAVFGPSLWVGRLTSVALTSLGMLIWMALMRRYGWRATAIFFALVAVNWQLTYFTAITKTHAAASLLIALGTFGLFKFWLGGRSVHAIGALIAALALTLLRLPALPITGALVAGILYVCWKHKNRRAAAAVVFTLVFATAMLAIFVAAVGADRFYYYNVGVHARQWSASLWLKLGLFPTAGNHLNRVFPLPLLIIASCWALYEWHQRKKAPVDVSAENDAVVSPPGAVLDQGFAVIPLLGGIGVVLGGAFHDPSQTDYFFIAIAPLAFVTAVYLDRVAARLPGILGRSVAGFVLALTVLVYAPFDRDRLGVITRPEGLRFPVFYAEQPAELMAAHKRSDGLVATTFVYGTMRRGLDVPVELTMADFACRDVTDSTARRLNIPNPSAIRRMISERQTEFVVTEDRDGGSMPNYACRVDSLDAILLDRYAQIAMFKEWGKYRHDIRVWQRRD